MNTAWLLLVGLAVYAGAYALYGRGLARRVVRVDDARPTPAHALYDGVDYAPAHPLALFGHHFASIAGAGPIVGPAIAVAWGWLPGLVWIWLGNVVIGAVHDYLAVMASVRSEGKSVQWIAGRLMNPRTSQAFQVFVVLALVLAVASFNSVIALNFQATPSVATASTLFIPVAMLFAWLHQRLRLDFRLATVIGLLGITAAVAAGYYWPVHLSFHAWVVILAIYCMVAASLPVWLLLQPRDYLNSYVLLVGLVVGAVAMVAAVKMPAMPAVSLWSASAVEGVPSPFWPTIPLIVACGSLSGIHALIGSGTTSKQVDKESHGLLVGFGGMLTEGLLSTMVVLAIAAYGMQVLAGAADALAKAGIALDQLTADPAYFGLRYLPAASAVGGALGLFIRSFGLAVQDTLGIPSQLATVFSGLWVTGFVLTSADTGVRVARFAWSEFFQFLKGSHGSLHRLLTDRWVASGVVAALVLWLSWGGAYSRLWPAFGGANQMIAAIALMTAALWVTRVQRVAGAYAWAVVIPAWALWVTVSAALAWYLWAVPANALVKGFVVIELVLAAVLAWDYVQASRQPAVTAPAAAAGGR